MQPDFVARAVAATMQRARGDAALDVQHGRDDTLSTAQQKAHRLVTLARRGSGHPRYDPAARLLGNWYVHVHAAALDQHLGGAERSPGIGAVEDLAAEVARVRVGRIRIADPLGPLRTSAFLWRVARTDAARSVVTISDRLHARVAGRSAAGIGQLDGMDEAQTAMMRHWYQRCYLAAGDTLLGSFEPLRAVTEGEAQQVAISVRSGRACRLIGADGVPLVTAHETRLTEADRRLAAGETRVVPADLSARTVTNRALRLRVTRAWNQSSDITRAEWAAAAGVTTAGWATPWEQIPKDQQAPLTAHWLHQHRFVQPRPSLDQEPQPVYPEFLARPIDGPPEQAAARMFGHTPLPCFPHRGDAGNDRTRSPRLPERGYSLTS